MIYDEDDFRKHTIAQADSGGYDPSGYVAVVKDNWAAIASFGHCSCYGTWTALTGGGINTPGNSQPNWSWIGTPAELLSLAVNNEDYGMKGRSVQTEDYLYGYLSGLYGQIREHYKMDQ